MRGFTSVFPRRTCHLLCLTDKNTGTATPETLSCPGAVDPVFSARSGRKLRSVSHSRWACDEGGDSLLTPTHPQIKDGSTESGAYHRTDHSDGIPVDLFLVWTDEIAWVIGERPASAPTSSMASEAVITLTFFCSGK